MKARDPKLIALLFNECINNQDIEGITNLLAKDHIFIDRKGVISKDMVRAYKTFFRDFPTYKKFVVRIDSKGNFVISFGYAKWSKESLEEDRAIWTAKIKDNLISEWCIHDDTEENRKKLT